MLGRTVNTQLTQSVRVNQIQATGNSNFGKVATRSVMHVTAGATGQGWSQTQCDTAAKNINEVLGLKQEAANNQRQYEAEELGEIAEGMIDSAMNNGCFIVY
jgi:hypothetical protein